ncbi:transcriptional regulator, LacI family [Methylobacterium sp. 4-46]|uniref:LacI family DNA-binding transcriptional regulator n=1 Tax=unclassified Methylobacterium TaxID=2615210 RepID=UPI000152BFAB|nr:MULTISPECIES: LacI family DNA-binding transcriptional regulator [Methylobacterium]ACA17066.1 transcriptional regulator, LacI family [Methylobacterium sp. 4-46]WFT82752.1 LacI family DNA-binding transcriptional regulator [Methylobacterium nodulans]
MEDLDGRCALAGDPPAAREAVARRPVTLADVAREARVGESTVSRVLRSHGSFSERTRAQVEAAVARLGYVPNRIAGTLASTGSRLIGIVIPSLTNIVFPDVLRGATGALDGEGFQSVIAVTDYDDDREEALVDSLLSWRPAGLLITGLEHNQGTVRRLHASGVRVAELLDLDGPGLDIVVGYSNRAAGEASARYLMARGYRRIAYLGHDLARDRRAGKRYAGFRAALAEAGLALHAEERITAPSSVEAGRHGLSALLARAPDCDAVYFSNDDMALGGYFHCLAAGITVPDRLALFGYNGLDVGRLMPQPLTTIRTPRVEAGATAARLLCTDAPATRVDLGFELIVGATA